MSNLVEVHPIKDVDNPRSVINIAPASVANAIRFIPDTVLEMTDRELRKESNSGEIEERLRITFWHEYDRAQSTSKNINLSNVYGGVCSQTHFLNKIVTSPYKMAYILTPPLNYQVQIEEILALGLEQLRDILIQPHINRKGDLDPKIADVKFKIVESMHTRVKGAVIQKLDARHVNVNVNGTTNQTQIGEIKDLNSMDEINDKLKLLQAKTHGELEVIDVQAREVTENGSGES